VAGVGVIGAEAGDSGGLAEDLRGGERTAACELLDEDRDLVFELIDLDVEGAEALDDLAYEPRDGAWLSLEPGGRVVEGAGPVERACGRLEGCRKRNSAFHPAAMYS
jgi:hypothetical protein